MRDILQQSLFLTKVVQSHFATKIILKPTKFFLYHSLQPVKKILERLQNSFMDTGTLSSLFFYRSTLNKKVIT